MNVLGHYLLFSPILALLGWIPLVGFLLKGIASLAAAIFSLAWGSCLHLFVMSMAWMYYRPVYGLLLLSGFGALIYLIFFFPDH